MITAISAIGVLSACEFTDLNDIENFNNAVTLNENGEIDLGEAWPVHTQVARFVTAMEALEKCGNYGHPTVVTKTMVDFWQRNADNYRVLMRHKEEELQSASFSARQQLNKTGPRFITDNYFITYDLGSGREYHLKMTDIPPGTVPEKVHAYYLREEINGKNCARHISNMQRRVYDLKMKR